MEIKSKVLWRLKPEENFLDGKYSRLHQWEFDGGLKLNISSSPEIVPPPMSDPALVDPEEAFLASISSCHMLFFLSMAAKIKLIVTSYEDNPEAILGKNEDGKLAVISIILKPICRFRGSDLPDGSIVQRLHERAHSQCFLANSIKTKITINL